VSRLQWFRLYTEARTDRKLDMLTDAEHRVWFSLMCYAFEQTGKKMVVVGDDREALAVEVARGDEALLVATLAKLVKPLRIVTDDGILIAFINGEARQYDKPSDMPAETRARQLKSRAVTPCHAEAPLEESRVEKKEQNSADCGFEAFLNAYPRRVGKQAASKAWAKLNAVDREAAMLSLPAWPFDLRDSLRFVPHPATWLNNRRWEDEADSGSVLPDEY